MRAVEYEVAGTIAVLTVQYPPVNVLSAAVRQGLAAALERARSDEAIASIVTLGGGTTFIAGEGDIDVAWVSGCGFPAHKGGPMFWGEHVDLDRIYRAALAAATRNGSRSGPGKLLERLAREGKGWLDA